MRAIRLCLYVFVLAVVLLLVLYRGLFLLGASEGEFEPPTAEARKAAVGTTKYLPAEERWAFSESDLFQGKRVPDPSDWLANHREPGQSFDQFLRTKRNRFEKPRTTLYLQPIGEFEPKAANVLDQVADYAGIFFDADVTVQDPVAVQTLGVTTRENPIGRNQQLLSPEVLTWLKKDVPKDAYARIAVTMIDLYAADSWNFVFGQASLRDRVGVYSFQRYGEPGTPRFLRRCLQVFAHDTGHMFAFYHCIHYECLMNGSNHLHESDQAPLFLCPVCLRKLHTANPFEIRSRYQLLGSFLREGRLEDEAEWIDRRLRSFETFGNGGGG